MRAAKKGLVFGKGAVGKIGNREKNPSKKDLGAIKTGLIGPKRRRTVKRERTPQLFRDSGRRAFHTTSTKGGKPEGAGNPGLVSALGKRIRASISGSIGSRRLYSFGRREGGERQNDRITKKGRGRLQREKKKREFAPLRRE